MKLVRPPATDLKMIVRADCAVSACSPLPQSIKALVPLVVSGGGSLESKPATLGRNRDELHREEKTAGGLTFLRDF